MRMQTPLFSREATETYCSSADALGEQKRALEDSSFPFEELSKIAEQESWRKEVNRPLSHIHKWWAQRLGSVFRALVLGTFFPPGADIVDLFYKPSRIGGAVVYDPFMGSGTTLGEVVKLGGQAVGRDINPVAHFLVKNALNLPQREHVLATYKQIEADVAARILRFYTARVPDGRIGQVLYFFWVKIVECLFCSQPVDLFSSYIFAAHAYPNKNPEVQILCPKCQTVHTGTYHSKQTSCPNCGFAFNPHVAPVVKGSATCACCSRSFRIIEAVQKRGKPPSHRLYAKLVLAPDEQKVYLAADEYDLSLYEDAVSELSTRANAYPEISIRHGYNTKQVLNYCYRSWREMFNPRQLLCLSILAERIRVIPDLTQRELFCCLFSGTLEFNNLFASYKGEGTGAVRHMFSHHVLKPERTPIEANVWGTPKSSGAFSTLFKSRILRAIEYSENPFELRVDANGNRAIKVFDLSEAVAARPQGRPPELACGDSSETSIASGSVDAVITDPPFFDNVHYSELADFFFVWQRYVLGENGTHLSESTRALTEVQHTDAREFEKRLGNVWLECRRVLKQDGLLVFTFHHSRAEGWWSLLTSLLKSKFRVIAVHPIKSEMSVGTPKHQAKEPINFDAVFVCRKLHDFEKTSLPDVLNLTREYAGTQLSRLLRADFEVSRNDVRLLVYSHAVRLLSSCETTESSCSAREIEPELESIAAELEKGRPRNSNSEKRATASAG
jgi:putative DNA methylase